MPRDWTKIWSIFKKLLLKKEIGRKSFYQELDNKLPNRTDGTTILSRRITFYYIVMFQNILFLKYCQKKLIFTPSRSTGSCSIASCYMYVSLFMSLQGRLTLETVRYLVSSCVAEVNTKTDVRPTPLHKACRQMAHLQYHNQSH